MEYKLLSLQNSDEWNSLMVEMPIEQQDVYCTPEYYRLCEEKKEGIAKCFVFKNDKGIALYPFLLNSVNDLGYDLNEQYYDIRGAYGYNGVISNNAEKSFLDEFSKSFLEWCGQNNVIAEFIRFNPLLNNHLLSPWISPIDLLDNIFIPLETHDDVWLNCFHRKVREAVRKAQRAGLSYISFKGNEMSQEYLLHFITIYNHMLERNKADESYYYSLNFFEKLKDTLPNNTLFSFALYDGIPISTELILHNSINSYAFLGGTLSNHFDKSPNTFLRYEITQDLLNKGIKSLNIGGGISRNDSLYLYKRSFNTKISSIFYIGKKVHNKKVYDEVVRQWEKKYPEKIEKYQNYILKYIY